MEQIMRDNKVDRSVAQDMLDAGLLLTMERT